MTDSIKASTKKSKISRVAERAVQLVQYPEKLFLLILVFGVLAIVGGLWYLRVHIYKAFVVNQLAEQSNEQSAQQAVAEYNKLLADQQKDTDKDGLTDYFEINVYKTSPYLPDTDSDGISDKDEIDKGTNPNCPEGKDCSIIAPSQDEGTDLKSEANSLLPNNINNFDFNQQIGQEMRKLLLQSGVDPQILEQVTDAELAQLYQQVVAEGADSQSLPSGGDLNNGGGEDLDASTIRNLLLDNGVDEGVLKQLTDEQLIQLYQEALQAESFQQ